MNFTIVNRLAVLLVSMCGTAVIVPHTNQPFTLGEPVFANAGGWIGSQGSDVAYQVGQRNRIPNKLRTLSLLISVSPDDFTRISMIQLATELKNDFSDEQLLSVDMFDNEKVAREIVQAGDSFSTFQRLRRGEYYLDRSKGYEYISFSTKRGKPVNEIVVNIGPNKPRWLKARMKKTRSKR